MDKIDLIVPSGRNRVVITGEVLETPKRSPTFETGTSKILGSLIDGRPFALEAQSSSYNIRVAEVPATDLSRQVNVLFFGEIYEGRVNAGDFVQIVARENTRLFSSLGRLLRVGTVEYTALGLTNSTAVILERGEMVESTIRPSLSVPAGAIRAIVLGIVLALALLVAWLASGGLATLLDLALAALLLLVPFVMLVLAAFMFLKAVLS